MEKEKQTKFGEKKKWSELFIYISGVHRGMTMIPYCG
jgi:hypothetical protein